MWCRELPMSWWKCPQSASCPDLSNFTSTWNSSFKSNPKNEQEWFKRGVILGWRFNYIEVWWERFQKRSVVSTEGCSLVRGALHGNMNGTFHKRWAHTLTHACTHTHTHGNTHTHTHTHAHTHTQTHTHAPPPHMHILLPNCGVRKTSRQFSVNMGMTGCTHMKTSNKWYCHRQSTAFPWHFNSVHAWMHACLCECGHTLTHTDQCHKCLNSLRFCFSILYFI